MKKVTFLLFVGALTLTACGDNPETEEKSEEIVKREITPELEKLIENLANCEAQNTNCDAYTVASKEIPALTQDNAERAIIIEDLVYIIKTAEDKKIQAAAHALTFWMGSSDYKDNSAYGKSILESLKNVEEDEEGYGSTGSQLGQLLASWWTSEDKDLRAKLIEFISDDDSSRSGRSELIRLLAREILDDDKIFSALMTIAKNSEEDHYIRNQAVSSLSKVQEDGNKTKVRLALEGMLSDSKYQISGSALQGLGYLDAIESFDKISSTIRAHKDDKTWYSYGSGCLTDLIRKNNDNLDKHAIYDLIKEMLSYKSMDAYYRSYFISSLHQLKTPDSKALMTVLKRSNEKDIVKEVERVSKY